MGRVGGLGVAKAIHDLCAAHGVPCWVGGMLESALGGSICLALATLENFTYPADIFPSRYFYRQDLCAPETVLSGPGEMTASPAPGVPSEPVPELLEERTVQHTSFRA
jgi:O-succinylbenzoate synthase